jgi:uncharacterized protein YdaT
MQTLYPAEIKEIQQIIERSRCHEELFLLDTNTAAVNIMQYLTKEGLLTGKVIPLKLSDAKEVYY